MSSRARIAPQHECRQCCTFCDRMVMPAGCVEASCAYLYYYDDESSGRRFMGCLGNVFRVEIDVEAFEEAQRTRQGFGGVKMSGTPTARCRLAVEQAYEGEGEAFSCGNPTFFEPPAEVAPDPGGQIDLRDRL